MKQRSRMTKALSLSMAIMLLVGALSAPIGAVAATPSAQAFDPEYHPGVQNLDDSFKIVMDNCDAAAASEYSRNPSNAGSVVMVDSPFGEKYGKAVEFSYNLSQGYNGVIRRRDVGGLPMNGAWTGLAAIALWVQIPAPAPNPILQLNTGSAWPGTSYEVDLKKLPDFDENNGGPQHLFIPIEKFLIKDGTTPIPSTESVISFAMYLGGSGTGVAYLDEITMVFAENVTVDNFNKYLDSSAVSAAWVANTSGGTNTRALAASDHGNAMNFTYDMATFNSRGYTGATKAVTDDWASTGAVSLWFTGDGLGQDILLQIASGSYYHEGWGAYIPNSLEVHLNDLKNFDPASTSPQYLFIPISEFKPKEVGMEFKPAEMVSFGLFVNKLSNIEASSSLVIDEIIRYVPHGTAPVEQDIIFRSTTLSASGNDSLLTVLNANATVASEGRVVGMKYASDNADILANYSGFVFNGPFKAQGTVNVRLTDLKLEIKGAVKDIALEQELVIQVQNLRSPVSVLSYLTSLSGKGVLTAMHNKEPNTNPRESTDRLLNLTGETPAIWSGDFLYQRRDVTARQTMINEAIRQWNDGALINIMLHVTTPNRTVEQEKTGASWDHRTAVDPNQNGVQAYLSEAQWTSLLTDGEPLNVNWKLRLDEYAVYLLQLKDAGVVPMFRPFHEQNQHVFWWNGVPEYTKALYRLTYDYLVGVKGLDNMIWVWDVQDLPVGYGDAYGYDATDWSIFNPGEEYWDIFALDVYDAAGYTQANYEQALSVAGDKPIAIGECWKLPSQETLAAQPQWIFAMPWAGDTFSQNTNEVIKTFYQKNLSIEDTPRFTLKEPEKFKIAIDNFDSYADSAALSAMYTRNSNGGQNTATLIASPFGAGLGNAMDFTYSFSSGYSGRYRSINGYWPGIEAIELWIQNDASHQDILLQLSDGASYECHLMNFADFDADSTEPQHLVIPISEFKRKEGSGTLNTKGVTSFAVYVNQLAGGAGGKLILDEITAVFPEEPFIPSVKFGTSEVQSDGASNIIRVLNANAVMPAGAKIVQATYESSNPAVLPNYTRFVPKGDFKALGETVVTVKQAKIYLDGATFTIDVNAALTVTVSSLSAPVDVVDYMADLTGNGILSAMHHDQSYSSAANCDTLHQRVANEFGVYPALYSADFLTGSTVPYRQNMINEIVRQWDNGNLVQIMFHVSPPQYTVAQERQGNWGGDQAHETLPQPNRIYSFLYNDNWTELLTDGTPMNTNWKLRMDEYARFLQQLEDAGVSVMLRPFHEMNQHVFWWGGRPGLDGSAGLYRMFHDYMEIEKGLSNIIWVWNIQDLPDNYGWADGDAKFDRYEGLEGGLAEYDANDWNSFNPGKDYYDVLSVDFYDAEGYASRHYEQAVRIALADGGKPIQIGETFTFPSQETLAAQPDWTLAMPWGVRTWNYNTSAEMATYYANSLGAEAMPRFATRVNELPSLTLSLDSACKTLVAGYDANIKLTVSGYDGSGELYAALYSGAERISEPAKLVDGVGKFKVSIPEEAGDELSVGVFFKGTTVLFASETIAIRHCTDLWTPILTEQDGQTLVVFSEQISLAAGKFKATVNGQAREMTVNADKKSLTISGGLLESADVLVIAGIKYPTLFPSYSFTFTLRK